MAELLTAILAVYRLVHLVVFDGLTEGLRERLGIEYERDEAGMPVDRLATNRAAEALNCHCCVSLAVGLLVAILPRIGLGWLLKPLALSGASMLLVRWQMSTRPRAEWWR